MRLILLTFTLLFGHILLANDTTPGGATATSPGALTENEGSVDTGMQVDGLNELVEHELVKPTYESCMEKMATKGENNSSWAYDSLGDCIWKELPQDTREALAEHIEENDAKEKRDKYSGKGLSNISADFFLGDDQSQTKAEMEKLQEFMAEKLDKGMYGENNDKIVGHSHYYSLYKTAIGKNAIQTMSAYCMGTDFELANDHSRFLYIEANLTDNQKKWQSALAQTKQTQGKDGSTKTTPKAVALWRSCLTHIASVCEDSHPALIEKDGQKVFISTATRSTYQKTNNDDDGKRQEAANGDGYCGQLSSSNLPGQSISAQTLCKNKFEAAHPHACTVVNSLKDAKNAIAAIKKITARFRAHSCEGADPNDTSGDDSDCVSTGGRIEQDSQNADGSAVAQKDRYISEGDQSVSRLATFSSEEIVSESGLKEQFEQADKDFKEKCYDGNRIIDEDACKKYISTDRNKREAEIAEFLLKRRALEERMAADFDGKDGEKAIKKALVEAGYTDDGTSLNEEGENLFKLKTNSGENFAKDQLKRKLAAETDALHQALLKRMNASTSAKDGALDASNSQDQEALAKIGEALADKTSRMKQLIRFNNIVSGFLEVDGGSSNLFPLQKEMGTFASAEGDEANTLDSIKTVLDDHGPDGFGDADSSTPDNVDLDDEQIDKNFLRLNRGSED